MVPLTLPLRLGWSVQLGWGSVVSQWEHHCEPPLGLKQGGLPLANHQQQPGDPYSSRASSSARFLQTASMCAGTVSGLSDRLLPFDSLTSTTLYRFPVCPLRLVLEHKACKLTEGECHGNCYQSNTIFLTFAPYPAYKSTCSPSGKAYLAKESS